MISMDTDKNKGNRAINDEELVLDYLDGKREIELAEIIKDLNITPHSLYKIVVKHDLEIL